MDCADLSRSSALTRFQLRVDRPDDLSIVITLLRETLSTISSPVFSELVLKLEGCPMENHFLCFVSGEVVWGSEWGMIDRDLDDRVCLMGRDIRLVIQVGAGGGVWTPKLGEIVGDVFPLMSARGLVSVVQIAKMTIRAREDFIW